MTHVLIELGDESPYPPLVDASDVDGLRRWFGKNITFACHRGDHGSCRGVCGWGSEVVEERPCFCPCHLR